MSKAANPTYFYVENLNTNIACPLAAWVPTIIFPTSHAPGMQDIMYDYESELTGIGNRSFE